MIAEWEVDALLVGSATNRRWLSGFTGSAGWLLITPAAALVTTDFRYWEQVQQQAPVFTLIKGEPKERLPVKMIQEAGVQKLAFESAFVTVDEFDSLKRKVENGVEWVGQKSTVEPLRAIKTPAELALMRQAAALADQTMALMPQLARPGVTERQLAWELEKALREAGADAVAFDIIVAGGPHGALPHHHPGDRPLQAGDAIVVDMGANVQGYRSDLTRTFYLGNKPSAAFQEVYGLVAQAQANVLQNMRAGMISKDIDALARDLISATAYKDYFGHGLGHGVGLDIHEQPRLSQFLEKDTIPAGAVVTVEPGIYIPGKFGVRIEDLVLLGDEGAEPLSRAPKSPVIPLPQG